jgi:S-DNA-T family DNA segregation ATPase FtsK/SpoIIIE
MLAEPLVLVYVDELAALTAYLTDRDLVCRGQAATSLTDSFRTRARETVKMRYLFRQGIGLSDGPLAASAWCHKIPPSMPGVGYVLSEADGRPVRSGGFLVTHDDINLAAARFPAPRQIPILIPSDQELAGTRGSTSRPRTSRKTNASAINGPVATS